MEKYHQEYSWVHVKKDEHLGTLTMIKFLKSHNAINLVCNYPEKFNTFSIKAAKYLYYVTQSAKTWLNIASIFFCRAPSFPTDQKVVNGDKNEKILRHASHLEPYLYYATPKGRERGAQIDIYSVCPVQTRIRLQGHLGSSPFPLLKTEKVLKD